MHVTFTPSRGWTTSSLMAWHSSTMLTPLGFWLGVGLGIGLGIGFTSFTVHVMASITTSRFNYILSPDPPVTAMEPNIFPATDYSEWDGLDMGSEVSQGTYLLFTRILHEGQDRRFDKVRTRPGVFLLYWTIQGVWILLTLLPTLMLNSKKQNKPVTKRDYIGWSLWAIGFLFEALADYQKSQFRADPANAGKFICHGLWSTSRHPNYFGEILMWSGLWLSASSVLSGWQQCVSLISPLFTSYLLIGISGIPLLEQYGQKKWGMDPAYQEYIKNTAKLVPYLW